VTTTADTAEISQLVADDKCRIKKVRLKASAGALKRGQVLAMNTSTNKWQALATSGSNGVNVARAILAKAVSDSTSEQDVEVYVNGVYRYDDLIWTNDQTPALKRQALEELADRGIHVQDPIWEVVETTTTTTTSTTTTTTTSTT
jgi:hypothetical protein